MKKITVRRHDGFGCHILWSIIALELAKINHSELEFVYTKLPESYKEMKSGIQDTGKMFEWEYHNVFGSEDLAEVNILFSKIMKSIGVDTIERSNMDCLNLGLKSNIGPLMEVQKLNRKDYFTTGILEKIRNVYYDLTDKPEIYDDEFVNIAIHVRRGDDLTGRTPRKKDHRNSYRWIPGKKYCAILEKLSNIENSMVHVFSQSSAGIADHWHKKNNIIFHQEEFGSGLFFDHWNKLVRSDILVLSPSAYSHSAGLFSKGNVITIEDNRSVFPFSPAAWSKNRNLYLGETQ